MCDRSSAGNNIVLKKWTGCVKKMSNVRINTSRGLGFTNQQYLGFISPFGALPLNKISGVDMPTCLGAEIQVGSIAGSPTGVSDVRLGHIRAALPRVRRVEELVSTLEHMHDDFPVNSLPLQDVREQSPSRQVLVPVTNSVGELSCQLVHAFTTEKDIEA